MLNSWPVDQQNDWDTLIGEYAADGGLLQSWQWGAFNEKLGNAVYNLANADRSVLCQAIQLKAGNQWILYVPRGPVFTRIPSTQDIADWCKDIVLFARERGCFMVRFDPAFAPDHAAALTQAGARQAKRQRNPKQTLTVDLTADEEVIAGAMKSKWRYNIKIAPKKGVTIRFGASEADANIFAALVAKTTDRQGFASYDADYFTMLINVLGPVHQAAFVIAELQGQPVAALLMGYFGRTAYYLHGASDYEQRSLMAPHALQWAAMLDAKQKGAQTYDFWGVSEKDWPGVTRFKQGFAPDKPFTNYVGTYELPVKRFTFALYRLRQFLKRS